MGGPEGQAFAQWLADNGQAGTGYFSTDIDYDINNALFSEGKAPFTVQGPWAISTYTDAGVNVAVNPIPAAAGGAAAPFVGVQGFYLSSQSENALIANEFLTGYIATEEAQLALYEADPRIPAWKSVAAGITDDPVLAGFIESAQTGVPMPSIPEMGLVWDLWNTAEVQIIQNGEDPVAVWDQMVEDLEAAIAAQ